MLATLESFCLPVSQVFIAGSRDAADTRALLRAAQRPFGPPRVVLLADGGEGQAFLAKMKPEIRAMRSVDGRAAAYVCEGFVCQEPLTDPGKLIKRLSHL